MLKMVMTLDEKHTADVDNCHFNSYTNEKKEPVIQYRIMGSTDEFCALAPIIVADPAATHKVKITLNNQDILTGEFFIKDISIESSSNQRLMFALMKK